ncbi:MAG: hypothetical protein KKA42_05425, partial [candidate division Zixibacteria bacterium]|nr:hypothetical protein [candidate division Zixibacteria bacterium]
KINLHRLTGAAIRILQRFVETSSRSAANQVTPLGMWLHREVDCCIAATLPEVGSGILRQFVNKGNLQSDEATLILNATEAYLTALGHAGETDSLPTYFRDHMPEDTHGRYLKDYKNIFERTIQRALEIFRAKLDSFPPKTPSGD